MEKHRVEGNKNEAKGKQASGKVNHNKPKEASGDMKKSPGKTEKPAGMFAGKARK